MVAGGLLLGILGLRLAALDSFWSDWIRSTNSGELVGYVVGDAGAVRHRQGGSWVWRDLKQKEKIAVYEGDTIFTGVDGAASVELQQGGAMLQISPNSLITFRRHMEEQKTWWGGWKKIVISAPSQPRVEVDSGQIRVRLKEGDKGLRVASKEREYRLEPGVRQSQIEFKVKANQTPQMKVFEESAAKSAAKNAQPAVVRAVYPRSGEVLSYSDRQYHGKAPLVLQWNVSGDVPPGAQVQLEWKSLSADEDARGSALALPEDRGYLLHLSPGVYQWRANLKGAPADSREKAQDSWQRFAVLYLPAPELIAPPADFTVSRSFHAEDPLGMEKVPVSVSWKGLKGKGISTEIEFIDEAGIRREFSSSEQNASPLLGPGEYMWRARLHFASNGLEGFSTWSEERKLAIEGGDPLVPVPTEDWGISDEGAYDLSDIPQELPASEHKVTPTLKLSAGAISSRLTRIEDLDEVAVDLEWNPIENAKEYLVEIYVPGEARPRKKAVRSSKIQFKMNPNGERNYSFRIISYVPDLPPVSSDKVNLQINLASPLLKSPLNEKVVSAGQDLALTWERTLFTDGYEVVVSKDADFKTAVEKSAAKYNFYMFNGGKAGKYYWRVRSFSKSRSSQWSEARTFTVERREFRNHSQGR